MPKIPRLPEPEVANIGGITTPSTHVSREPLHKVNAAIGQKIFEVSSELMDRRIQALTRSYASEAYSKDLLDSQQFLSNLKARTNLDGSTDTGESYAQRVTGYFDRLKQERATTAPSGEALAMYESKFDRIRMSALLQANEYENQLRIKSIDANREQLINKAAMQYTVLPDLNEAYNFLTQQINSINSDAGDIYDPVSANDLKLKMQRKIADSYFDGLLNNNNPEMALAVASSGYDKAKVKESLAAAQIPADTILPDVNEEQAKLIRDSLNPGDLDRIYKESILRIRNKYKAISSATRSDVKDISTVLSTEGSSPQAALEKDRIKRQIHADSSIRPIDKLELIDEMDIAESVGDAKKKAMELNIVNTRRYIDTLYEEVGKRRTRLPEELLEMKKRGYTDSEIAAARDRLVSKSFNATKMKQVEDRFKREFEASRKSMLNQAAAYWTSNDPSILQAHNNILQIQMDPDAAGNAFAEYADKLDVRMNSMGLSKNEKKYLTGELSKFYANRIMTASNGPAAMNEIFAIQREHGFRARQTFDEMVKNKDIPEHIYSLSLIDPEKRNMGERLFTLVSDADRVKELEDIFVADDRKAEMRNMMNAINSKFSDLNYALGRANPGGGNRHIINGLKRLMRLGVINDKDIDKKLSLSDAITKWGAALVDGFKVADHNESVIFTSGRSALYHDDAVEFIETFDDPYYFWEAPDSLMKQLAKLGISTEIKPNRFDDNLAKIAEDPEYREDVMNGVFGAAGFVTTDTMDGLQIMYEDKDGIRHKLKDENGKDVIVPLNRLKEIQQPESYMIRKFKDFFGFPEKDLYEKSQSLETKRNEYMDKFVWLPDVMSPAVAGEMSVKGYESNPHTGIYRFLADSLNKHSKHLDSNGDNIYESLAANGLLPRSASIKNLNHKAKFAIVDKNDFTQAQNKKFEENPGMLEFVQEVHKVEGGTNTVAQTPEKIENTSGFFVNSIIDKRLFSSGSGVSFANIDMGLASSPEQYAKDKGVNLEDVKKLTEDFRLDLNAHKKVLGVIGDTFKGPTYTIKYKNNSVTVDFKTKMKSGSKVTPKNVSYTFRNNQTPWGLKGLEARAFMNFMYVQYKDKAYYKHNAQMWPQGDFNSMQKIQADLLYNDFTGSEPEVKRALSRGRLRIQPNMKFSYDRGSDKTMLDILHQWGSMEVRRELGGDKYNKNIDNLFKLLSGENWPQGLENASPIETRKSALKQAQKILEDNLNALKNNKKEGLISKNETIGRTKMRLGWIKSDLKKLNNIGK